MKAEEKMRLFRRLLTQFRDERRAENEAAHWMSEWDKGYMGAMETVFDLLDKYGIGEREKP